MTIVGTISSVDQNNFIPVSFGSNAGLTIEALTETFTRYDFTFQGMRFDGEDLGNNWGARVGLIPNRVGILSPYEFVLSLASVPLYVEWTNFEPADGTGNYTGIPGTATEIWGSYGVEVSRRLNVAVGSAQSGAVINPGPRYTFLISGTEYRSYINYRPGSGQPYLVRVAGPAGGLPFPFRLGIETFLGAANILQIRNVMVGGAVGEKTIYSAAEKDLDGITTSLHFRIFQHGDLMDGFYVDIDT